ncbi:spore germination protein [Bacillus tuaregi]|uniref:spore germination protein n=1 Tax=Bacillus tuaregi TaxID=1816695 RepID=UPI0009FC868B|nr:spore germination protein [Bacillus tuaregi]
MKLNEWIEKSKEKKSKSINQIAISEEKKEATEPFNVEDLKKIFANNSDVVISPSKYGQHELTFIYCSGLVKTEMLFTTIPIILEKFFECHRDIPSEAFIQQNLHIPSLRTIKNKENAVSEVFGGKLLLYFTMVNTFFMVDISERPQRSPEDTKAESTILGPRDDFIEDLNVNYSLIRKRLRTPSLVFEEFTVGQRSNTKLLLLYMDDIASKEILKEIKKKISQISTDSLTSRTQFEELINDHPYDLFPKHKYTGKPDFAVESLLSGRFVILIDGVATAYITPITFHVLFKSNEDREVNYIFSSLERFLRVSGLLVSTLLPGFWISLTTFHQDQLPLTLLATVVETRRGVPFPAPVEAFGMLLLFDLFREAGVRLPMAIGQILSVVGGLIIGDAAIRSGLTSPSMLVIIALSTVSTFTLIDQSVIGAISVIRFFSIIMGSILGFFGVLMSFFILLSYMGSIQVFGVAYLDGMNEFNSGSFLKTFFRLPHSALKSRPEGLNLQDETRKDDSDHNKTKG